MARLVDTDVFSFYFKDDMRKVLYEPHLHNQFLFMSFMTYTELGIWRLSRDWGANLVAKLDLSLRRYSIQHSNQTICDLWADIIFASRKTGKTIAHSDAWIAATAIALDVSLVSHNARHFQHIERLNLISENNIAE